MHDFSAAMREAARLACNGRWHVAPNPCVGAVLVRNGAIVASGWHARYGGPHAERACLADAAQKGIDPAECTLVVTLEPCSHHGKTPPCTDAVLEAGIRHVVVGCMDPNPSARGGAEILRMHGVRVDTGVEETLCADVLADFFTWQRSALPYVVLKLASTLDGRIATRSGHSRWISGVDSRRRVHEMRAHIGACGGAVLVGGGTFFADNPGLDARMGFEYGPQPLAVIVSSRLPGMGPDKPCGAERHDERCCDTEYSLLTKRPGQTIFMTGERAAASDAARRLEDAGVRVWALASLGTAASHAVFADTTAIGKTAAEGMLDIAAGLTRLRAETGCPYVLCEGGGSLGLHLLERGLVGEFHLHLSPKIMADAQARPLFSGLSPLTMHEVRAMRFDGTERVGEDLHLLLRPLNTEYPVR